MIVFGGIELGSLVHATVHASRGAGVAAACAVVRGVHSVLEDRLAGWVVQAQLEGQGGLLVQVGHGIVVQRLPVNLHLVHLALEGEGVVVVAVRERAGSSA